MDNVAYGTDQISRYFSQNRVRWDQFYESERRIIERLGLEQRDKILDIGCGCGGLGLALREKFGVTDYTGVEINRPAAESAKEMNRGATIVPGDILSVSGGKLAGRLFDVVFSLSCVDWNVRFADMLAAAWTHVTPGGRFVATFRLTTEKGCNDITRSYQFVSYNGQMEGERASYVVLNAGELVERLLEFDPAEISAYGYWGKPSPTAVTPFKDLCFAAFSIRKRAPANRAPVNLQLDLPTEIVGTIETAAR
jgi:SAM-dependent methyltransferase